MIYELPGRQILVDGLIFTKEFKVKKLMIVVLGMCVLSVSANAAYTRGYMKKNGTYVSGYHRTSADHTRINNYSTRGNINPYTGKKGYKPLTKYGY